MTVREGPILMVGPMVRATLERRKQMTRRVVLHRRLGRAVDVKRDDSFTWIRFEKDPHGAWHSSALVNPYGMPGDRLWVRESWRVARKHDGVKPSALPFDRGLTIMYAAGGSRAHDASGQYVYDNDYPPTLPDWAGKLRPSIFLPRRAARITLEITKVRVERLQEISDDDAKDEGMESLFENGWHRPDCKPWHERRSGDGVLIEPAGCTCPNYSDAESFAHVWNPLNAKRGHGWDVNPYVWVIEFKLLEGA